MLKKLICGPETNLEWTPLFYKSREFLEEHLVNLNNNRKMEEMSGI
jgi:hypothetical protein